MLEAFLSVGHLLSDVHRRLTSTYCRRSALVVAGLSPATETAATAMAVPWLSSVIYVAFQPQQLIGASSWIKS